jgi:hypothetical protein
MSDDGETSHGSQAYVSLAQLTDGGEAYCQRLELIARERRLDYRVADHAKEIARKEQMQPKDMSETRLKNELQRRHLYEQDQPMWALVIALEEAIRNESRILRLHQATTQVLIKGTAQNKNKVKAVINESKKQHRNKRISQRAAINQQKDELIRRKVTQRCVFLSLTHLDREFANLDKNIVNDGIFIFDLKKNWIHQRDNNVPLIPEGLDEHYITCSPELYELLWRKEERGEVIFVRSKSFKTLSKALAKITILPREDDTIVGKKLSPLALQDFWWSRTWKKVLPLHAPLFTSSNEKIRRALATDCFEEFSVAEIIFQSNPTVLKIFGVLTLKERLEMQHVLRTRLPGDSGYGNDGIEWQEAELQRKQLQDAIEKEEKAFWDKVQGPKNNQQQSSSSSTLPSLTCPLHVHVANKNAPTSKKKQVHVQKSKQRKRSSRN